jgi:hypothetical protein
MDDDTPYSARAVSYARKMFLKLASVCWGFSDLDLGLVEKPRQSQIFKRHFGINILTNNLDRIIVSTVVSSTSQHFIFFITYPWAA